MILPDLDSALNRRLNADAHSLHGKLDLALGQSPDACT